MAISEIVSNTQKYRFPIQYLLVIPIIYHLYCNTTSVNANPWVPCSHRCVQLTRQIKMGELIFFFLVYSIKILLLYKLIEEVHLYNVA